MSGHEKLSPSKAPRWRACPGSVREEAKYPDERSSAAAIDGTHTHTLLSTVVEMAFMPASAWIGQELEDGDGKFVVDADRAERVQFAHDFILSRGGKVFSERKVDPAPLLGIDGLAGTADITIVHEDGVEIFDYKDGVSPVNPNTPQNEQYGFGVIAKMGAEKSKYKTITLGIIQPKLRAKGLVGVAYITKTMDVFMEGAPALIADAKATQAPDAPLIPGDHCHWCKHKGACSALGNKVMEVVQFADLTKPASGTMLDEQIAKIIENKAMILELIEGAEKEALRRFEIGQPIAGLKAIKGRGSRDWSVDEDKLVEVLKKCGVPTDACYDHKLISPAKMEKLKWVKRDGSEHTLSDKHRAMLQSEYIRKSDGKLTVVPAADDRPAVELGAAQMFGAVNADLPSFLIPLKE